jgi:hypothetical protein
MLSSLLLPIPRKFLPPVTCQLSHHYSYKHDTPTSKGLGVDSAAGFRNSSLCRASTERFCAARLQRWLAVETDLSASGDTFHPRLTPYANLIRWQMTLLYARWPNAGFLILAIRAASKMRPSAWQPRRRTRVPPVAPVASPHCLALLIS